MPFDQPTRNLLQRTVSRCRDILAGRWDSPVDGEFFKQLQEIYGISPDGTAAPLEVLEHLSDEDLETARVLREILDHYTSGLVATGKKPAEARREAVLRLAREQAFTVLNRLAALRMAEERGIVLECVRQGLQSEGFQLFQQSAGTALGSTPAAYRTYLFVLFDELSRDLGVLFNRFDKSSLLFPRHTALEAILRELNGTGSANKDAAFTPAQISALWSEDEAIGWIYQYYNDQAERKAMRDESAAPRNSRELAVRNQFFTPRYVVEFLTDNTLGRIWYEMTKGQTRLKDQCRYLVRRPNEIFLTEGQASPTLPPAADNCSQEDLLRQPVHIPHRPLKDPREIRMIDPACGSMHFGLYAFDLFSVIYDEAWEMAHGMDAATKSAGTFTPFVTFVASFADKASFLREVPRLIVEHNIHGIDIDPRAAQIAGLALWLRAQRGWQALGLKSSDRPPIRRSNIVCAEPMPGERGLLREFVDRHFPQGERSLFQSFLENVWDKMRLAGEAGSLLKIEEEIRSAIEDARDAWQKLATKPLELFTTTELNQLSTAPELTGLEQAVSCLTTDPRPMSTDFWERIEERIYAALRDYAEQAENGGGFQRRLFAEDAARGFAFIDVCRKRYDVALMNPPFGLSQAELYSYLNREYPDSFIDLLAAFIVRADTLAPSGFVGAITSRACLYTKTLLDWRKAHMSGRISALADFGIGVLDGAMVRACAYVIHVGKQAVNGYFIDARKAEDKGAALLASVQSATTGEADGASIYCCDSAFFALIPQHRILYWLPRIFWQQVRSLPAIEPQAATIRAGLTTYDDVRFLRLRWEVATADTGSGNTWVFLSKGGYFSTFYNDVHLVVLWANGGNEVGAYNRSLYETDAQSRRGSSFYLRPAVTYSRRTDYFSARALPDNCFFSDKGPCIIPLNKTTPTYLLGVFNSDLFRGLVHAQSQGGCFETGILKFLPWSEPDKTVQEGIEFAAKAAWKAKARVFSMFETDTRFISPMLANGSSIADCQATSVQIINAVNAEAASKAFEISSAIAGLFGLSNTSFEDLDVYENDHEVKEAAEFIESPMTLTAALASFAFGSAIGRWDIRYATGEQAAPELPDPFAPLPVCPPGQLQNAQGLPARPEDVPAAYPVRIPWDGILVDDPNHPLDLERRVREVIEIIWSGKEGGPTAEAIEHEACEILGVKSLRDYFRKPTGFFADHLKRYSKSRRQAPIYWPLSSPNGLYTVWLYYHRLTPDTLFTVLRDHVKPKLEYEERQAFQLRQEAGTTPSTSQRRDIAEAEELVEDLRAFKAELDRVAPLFRPDLNDGVIINHAPLWRMIGLPKWRKDCQATWNELVKGDYDWAHLALHLWPERVIPKCATDRSLAIAHGLDAIFWREDPEKPGKWIARKVTDLELRGLIAERTSAAVKAAVESLVGATSNEGAPRRGRKGAKA